MSLVPLASQQVSSRFHSLMTTMQSSELSENVGASFAVIGIRGKVFRLKHGGNENPVMTTIDGQQYAAPYLDVVIVRANGPLSKTYYKDGYTEGADGSPDCWSEDGVHPLSPLQNRPLDAHGACVTDCRLCPLNVFGSKINQVTGKGSKACADTRKLAVLPANDLINEAFGGPMLLRIPAASLGPLAEFDRKLKAMGVPYFAVVVRVTFEGSVAYPKLEFAPVRMLTDAEADQVIAMRSDFRTDSVLASGQTGAPTAPPASVPAPTPVPVVPAPAPAPVQFAPPVAVAPAPAPAAVGVSFGPPPTTAPALVQAPAPAPSIDQSFFEGIDALLAS